MNTAATPRGDESSESLRHSVRRIVLQAIPKLRVEELDDATSLFDLGIDSLDQAKAFIMVEDELGIEIDDEDINGLESIDDLVAYCQARCPDRP